MAKKTKDSNLSIEERLEQALIPNWDEPYKLPNNWCWTKIGVITDLYRGVSYKKHEGHSEKGINDCLVMRGGNIKEGEIDIDADNIYVDKKLVSKEQYVKKHDVVIVSSTGSTKVIGRAGISFADYDDVAFGAFLTLVRPSESVHKPYVSYYFQGDMYRNRMRQLASGVNINNIRNEYITDTPIPMPPLDEQRRIVGRIESLFAKLEEAEEKAQEIVDGFEKRKAAILHKAFSGELTEIWRKENDRKIDEWVDLTFGDVIVSVKNGTTAKQTKEKTNWPVTRIETLQNGTLDLSRVGYVVDPNTISEDDCYIAGDIAFSHINSAAHVGKTALIESHFLPLVHGMNLLRIRLNDLCLPQFMVWYSRSSKYKELIMQRINMAVNQVSINQKQLKTMPIKLPTVDEQFEIVKKLDSLITKELQAKEIAEAVIEQIYTMKKAILARAFRAELGTNDPDEESAVELLKKVLGGDAAVQTPAKKPTKRISIPSDVKELLSNIREEEIIKLLLKSAPQPVTIQEIMSLSSKKFELMDALRSLEKKQLITKNEFGEYSLTR